jgi:hypothetical protein
MESIGFSPCATSTTDPEGRFAMPTTFAPETLERYRSMTPDEVIREVTDAVYRSGAASSDDFLDAFDELVERGVLSWDQVEDRIP